MTFKPAMFCKEEATIKVDPLAAAKARGLKAKEELCKAEGGVISLELAAARLNKSQQEVDEDRDKGKLIALPTKEHRYDYPVWQFVNGDILPGLESVLAELSVRDGWMQVAFMVNANTRLNGESPLAMLKRGDVQLVRQAARAYGEQGAL